MRSPFAITMLLILFLIPVNTARAADCDRACLRGLITEYLNAMLAHNPSKLPLAPKVRFTEDTVEMRLGEGLWKNASAIRPFRQDILDVRQGVAATEVVMEEGGTPVLFVLRMKVVDRKISEIETQVTRNQEQGRIFSVDALKTASKAMEFVPERSQLASREEATRIALFYPAGLKIGSFVKVDAPFSTDAYRIENGRYVAGPAAANEASQNIKTQRIIEHPAVTTRVAAVDEEMGIVLLRMNFGDTNSYGPGNALIVWEAFKVYGGQIHAVEAFMRVMPATTPSGWD